MVVKLVVVFIDYKSSAYFEVSLDTFFLTRGVALKANRVLSVNSMLYFKTEIGFLFYLYFFL